MTGFPFQIKISASLSNVMKNFTKLERGITKVSDSARKLGSALTLGVTTPLIGLGGLAIKTSADFEKMRVSLNTAFQGNQEAAEAAQDQITKFAASTPFQLEEVLDSFIKLKNMGLDPSEEALTSYGNTAGAMGKSLNQMIEAVADAATGEFERLKEFGIKTKSEGDKVTFTFKGQSTTVRKNSEEIQRYLLQLGNTEFAGGMVAQSKTLYGVFSTLSDSVTNAFGKIGDSVVKVTGLKGRLEGLTGIIDSLADRFVQLSPETQEFLVWAGLTVAALGPVLMVFGNLGFAIVGLTASITALTPVLVALGSLLMFLAANPITYFVVTIGLIAKLFTDLVKMSGSVSTAIKAAFLGMGSWIFSAVIAPIQKAMTLVMDGLEAIGIAAPESLRSLAEFDYDTFAERTLASNVSLSPQRNQARVDVNFNNAPTGMRVNQQTYGLLEMHTNVGHQLRVP